MRSKLFAFILIFMSYTFLSAQMSDTTSQENTLTDEQMEMLYQIYVDSVAETLTYEKDQVSLKDGLASIQIPSGFKYLNGEDSDMILTDIWGNPPSDAASRSLGMILPADHSPFTDSSFVINITYAEEGYVDDSDASDIDYDDLLESMQEDAEAANAYRVEQGYPVVEIVGWASPPFYDAATKKLHWAKEIKFGEADINTLNYNIRVLGRKGFLQLNVIGEMFVLDKVKASINPVLSSVNFDEGNTYADFDPDVDDVAAYGIGALIAGKVLAKAGLFAKLGIFLAKFWKILAIGAVAVFGGIKKFFGGKKKDDVEA